MSHLIERRIEETTQKKMGKVESKKQKDCCFET